MFKKGLHLFTYLLIHFTSAAQAPHKMNFQAVLRDAQSSILSQQQIGVRISILKGGPSGLPIYTEIQTARTDINGLMSLQIGNGVQQLGHLASIDWGNGPFFLKTETDISGGIDYTMVGTSELLSVPFALYALNSGSTKGVDGTHGTNGLDGTKGVDGIKGLDGTNGSNGTKGLDGEKGLDGTNGTHGTNGSNGTNGLDAPAGEPTVAAGTIQQYYRGDKSWQYLNAASVNLGNVDNTNDVNKIISTPTQTALNLKSPILSPEFTGTPLSTTAEIGDNSTRIATTAYVNANTNQSYSISAGNELTTTSTTDVAANGINLSPAAGKYNIQYNAQFTIEPISTLQSGTDLDLLYSTLLAKSATNSTHSATYSNETLLPGVYTNSGAVTANGTVTLNAQNNPNAQFIFRFGGAFSTGAGLNIVLTNGASACNIYWVAEGAIALGAETSMQGTLIANIGAITLGSLSKVNGSLFSTNGAIGIDAATITSLSSCENISGTMNHYAIFSKNGAISNINHSLITGDIATHVGLITGFSTAAFNGAIESPGLTNTYASFSIYKNGVLVPYSTRTYTTSSVISSDVNLQAIATLASSDILDIRWKVGSGTLKMTNRIFSALQVR